MANLKEGINQVVIEGLLSENKLEKRTTADGRNYITGEMLIEVTKDNVVGVQFLSFEKKKDGGLNKVYASLATIMTGYKSIAQVGRDAADKVRVTSGQFDVNDFYAQDGRLVTYPRIKSNFINRVPGNAEFKPRAEFQVETFIRSMINEVINEEESGRLILKTFLVTYGGNVKPMDFIVEDEKGIKYIQDNYKVASTAKLSGKIINTTIEKTTTEEQAFGDPIVTTKTSSKREYVVTKGTEAYDSDNAFDPGEVKAAMQQREQYLVDLKAKQEARSAAKTTTTSAASGEFGDF